jgi:hypothetical protein
VLCWKAGKSFVLVSGNPKSLYGKLYRERKAYEQTRNDSGANAELATQTLAAKRWDKSKPPFQALSKGRLPDGQIDARARRYAVKIFLSHFHAKWRELSGLPVPTPYPIAHLDHHDLISVDDAA